jgi:hypothetical protein
MSEIPQIVLDTKEKTLPETGDSLWQDKTSCWEIEGAYCNWNDWGSMGVETSVCQLCEVHSRWGTGKSVELKLRGKGMSLIAPIPSAK